MTKEQFERERTYRVTLYIVKSMLDKGLITEHEYRKIDAIMFEKYRPILGALWR